MKKIKNKISNIIKFLKEFQYKEYASTNKLFITFIISSLLNGMFLRFFTVHNYFAIKPILADLAIVLILGSFVYLFKAKKQFTYLMVVSIIFNIISLSKFVNTRTFLLEPRFCAAPAQACKPT